MSIHSLRPLGVLRFSQNVPLGSQIFLSVSKKCVITDDIIETSTLKITVKIHISWS